MFWLIVFCCNFVVFFCMQKTAYELRISDWSSDVCSSDLYCLLGDPSVQAFLGTEAYVGHKDERFPAADNKVIAENAAFELSNQATRDRFARAYAATSALYYRGQPSLDDILGRSEERSVGQEGVSKCRSRGATEHYK